MTKAEAVAIFGQHQVDLAKALGISKAAVSNWPDELTQSLEDRVIGAAVRLGKTQQMPPRQVEAA